MVQDPYEHMFALTSAASVAPIGREAGSEPKSSTRRGEREAEPVNVMSPTQQAVLGVVPLDEGPGIEARF
jgi:hypothetical protein